MFPIYLKIAIRNLFKDKTFSLINLAGLTIGLATAGLLLLWVQNELGFDKYHKESEKYSELIVISQSARMRPGIGAILL